MTVDNDQRVPRWRLAASCLLLFFFKVLNAFWQYSTVTMNTCTKQTNLSIWDEQWIPFNFSVTSSCFDSKHSLATFKFVGIFSLFLCQDWLSDHGVSSTYLCDSFWNGLKYSPLVFSGDLGVKGKQAIPATHTWKDKIWKIWKIEPMKTISW